VLQQKKQIRNAFGTALLDQAALESQRLVVGNEPEAPDLDRPAEAGHYVGHVRPD
jgi:hypothetical protein